MPAATKTEHRPQPIGLWVSTCVAVALLVTSGFAYRLAASQFAQLTGAARLPQGTLSRLPLRIGDWVGHELAINEAVIRITDTDDRISRTYSHRGNQGKVSLFVGFGTRMRDLMPHRPQVCYPGAGWTHEQTRRARVTMNNGAELPCQIHAFSRGGLDTRRVTVLNYYLIDGKFYPDVEELRSQAWQFRTDVGYVAQVQIASGQDWPRNAAEKSLRAFAAASAGLIQTLLAEAVAITDAGETGFGEN